MNTEEVCKLAPVIPVLTVKHVAEAAPLAEALIKGGLPALEVTLRTPAALDVIREMAEVEGGVVGAGTLLTARDVESAKKAGARFGVSPGATPMLLDAADANDLPLLPGVSSASEVIALLERGITVMKLFPAEAVSGTALLKSFAAALAAAKFCPTGGINILNASDYLALSNVLCVGGSWISPTEAMSSGNWSMIESLAREAVSSLSASGWYRQVVGVA